MAYIKINQAQIHFDTFGVPSKKPPILLIHGSTITGHADWHVVAPLLAQWYFVIVPDCRGHGKSSNPTGAYSFRQMAGDAAALVQSLGFERAHIIGHSNGGNVALVTLLEHPEVIQTAVLQAANAYVSPDLIEKEPPLFDPERVRRERPAWMEEMIALHGQTHGPDYWRALLQSTVQEIITEPNYTPERLSTVGKPTLVIQGELDRVNAPARHAQFIARHIPHAELWLPSRIGHNVHIEITLEWVQHVLDFLERRGDAASDALYRARHEGMSDDRRTIFEVRAQSSPDGVELHGKVLLPEQRQASIQAIPNDLGPIMADHLQTLLDEHTPWALVNRSVMDLRSQPSNTAERVSQALLGEAVQVLEEQGDWSRVRVEHDGYLGWAHSGALYLSERTEVETYLHAREVLVLAELLPAFPANPEVDGVDLKPVGKLPFMVALPIAEQGAAYTAVRLPDGRLWWVATAGLLPIGDLPEPDAQGVAWALALLHRLIGTPYLWGGRSPFGYDCSGLAQTFLRLLGVNVLRDADQQYQAGAPVEGEFLPGDLLFFGDHDPERPATRFANVTHMAISLGGEEVIHSSNAVGGVRLNSLSPASSIFRAWLRERYLGARRYL